MAENEGRLRQAAWRKSLREKGLREVSTWLPDDLRQTIQEEVRKGRFESQNAALSYAIEQVFRGNFTASTTT